jgi:hypothetical protein
MRTIFLKALQLVVIAAPFYFLFLPIDYFDGGEPICPSKRFLDIDCPGCGLTRGIMHLLHFDFTGAWEYNALSFPILIALGIVWLHVVGLFFDRDIFPWLKKLY